MLNTTVAETDPLGPVVHRAERVGRGGPGPRDADEPETPMKRSATWILPESTAVFDGGGPALVPAYADPP